MPAVRFVDISYFVKSGQLFIIMFIYADQEVARKSIFTNINLAIAGQKVYSKSAENTTKESTLRTFSETTIKSPYHHNILKFYSSPTQQTPPPPHTPAYINNS